jgi:hypothetical protein
MGGVKLDGVDVNPPNHQFRSRGESLPYLVNLKVEGPLVIVLGKYKPVQNEVFILITAEHCLVSNW